MRTECYYESTEAFSKDPRWQLVYCNLLPANEKKNYRNTPTNLGKLINQLIIRFQLTLQLLKALQLNEPSPINLALEFDVLWKIPNESKLLVKKLRRRHRRELYANFELALNRFKEFAGKNFISLHFIWLCRSL